MIKTLSLQTYSVRDKFNDREESKATFKALASYGYTGAQIVAANYAYGLDDFANDIKEVGMSVIGTHVPVDLLLNAPEAARVHEILGTKNAGIGSFPNIFKADFSKEDFDSGVETIHKIIEGFKPYGLKFTLHHHSGEFAKFGNERMMDIFMREFDPKEFSFVLDTYWLQHAGANVIEWIGKTAGWVDILHIKDKGVKLGTNEGVITELGNGNINFKEVFKAAEAAGITHLCYEQDNGFAVDSLDSAKRSAEFFYSIMA